MPQYLVVVMDLGLGVVVGGPCEECEQLGHDVLLAARGGEVSVLTQDPRHGLGQDLRQRRPPQQLQEVLHR